MKITRRSLLKAAGIVGLSPVLMTQRYSNASGQASDNARSASSDAIQFHRLVAEPLVKSSYPTHERFQDGMAGSRVVIAAQGLERVNWEVRREQNCWLLALPEMFYVRNARFDYQSGMEWKKEHEAWSYTNCPLRNLVGRWTTINGKQQLTPGTEQNVPIVGRMVGTVHSDLRGVHYGLTVTNTSNETWKDVFFWICLNHYQSPITGYRPHLRVGNSWLPAQEMPSARVHTYYPAPGMVEEYSRCAKARPEFHAADSELSFPGVVCWNYTAKGPLLVCHCSKDAMAVGSNQLWPCTDLQLWFGDLAPGQQKSKTGHVLIADGDLGMFAKHADSILDQLKLT